MKNAAYRFLAASVVAGSVAACASAENSSENSGPISFFITSVGMGDGANLGGLAGADAHCQKLASALGQGGRTWHAYLSAPSSPGQSAVHARDRIGTGPWFNAKGVRIASNLDDLHSASNNLGRQNSLTESAGSVSSNSHDILTGSNPDGALASGVDVTCGGWTSNSASGRAMLGHFDKRGGGERPNSWNSAHLSAGCGQAHLVKTGGSGLFYCFATN